MVVLLIIGFLVLVFLTPRKRGPSFDDVHLQRNRRSTTYAARQGRTAAHGGHKPRPRQHHPDWDDYDWGW